MKTLTVIAPAYNEEAVIADFYKTVRAELDRLQGYKSDIVLVVDGGKDRTIEILRELATKDTSLRVIRFSRNFGHQMAFLAGLDAAEGDAVVMMDCDLQHPPSLIPVLLKQFEAGNEVVYTMREKTPDVTAFRRLQSYLFYRFLNAISEIPIGENTSDFRLLSQRVVRLIRENIRERNLFLRGIVSWIGFKQSSVSYHANERFAGESKFPLSRLISFGLSGVLGFSKKPLRIASFAGFFVALFGVLFALFTVWQYFFTTATVSGYSTIVVLMALFSGFQLMFLGVLGEYVGAIFDQVKGRPLYIVEEVINIK